MSTLPEPKWKRSRNSSAEAWACAKQSRRPNPTLFYADMSMKQKESKRNLVIHLLSMSERKEKLLTFDFLELCQVQIALQIALQAAIIVFDLTFKTTDEWRIHIFFK